MSKNPKPQKPLAKVFTPEEIAAFEEAKLAEATERAEACSKEFNEAQAAIMKKYNCRLVLEGFIGEKGSGINAIIVSN